MSSLSGLNGSGAGGGGGGASNALHTTSSARFEFLTEAVPLSLSSMAHASLALDDGVSDGIEQVLQHTLLSCVNYARIMHPPHSWTFRDLCTSPFAWNPIKTDAGGTPPKDIPFSLEKLKFVHQYTRNALIYLRAAYPPDNTLETETEILKSGWSKQIGILGRVSLLYISTEPLTKGEMDGTDTDDMPPCVLYKVLVEYRSLPPTGNQQAVQAEELSMLSFGGSVDDNVKFGALASLYDNDAKYVLEIYSVRGKKYKFDLMDSTLSNGTIPRLPSSREGDPFVKSLCVTVSDHQNDENPEHQSPEEKKYAITRMHILLEGKLKKIKGNNIDDLKLPPFDYVANGIKASFLHLNPEPPLMVTALPSGHTLLLDPELAGRIYVNGNYVTTWGLDPRIGSHGIALFGMDLHSIPMWHNSIVNYEDLKLAYAQLWHEILIDARLLELNVASRLLNRLMKGHDAAILEDDDDEAEYDDDDTVAPSTNIDCLESQVLASNQYDRVGIAPKALATRFGIEFGKDAFPCLQHEVQWVKSMLPDRKPVVVPQRLINIIRRGGYFDTQRTSDDLWFGPFSIKQTQQLPDGDAKKDCVLSAIEMLENAGCEDITPEQIAFTSMPASTMKPNLSADAAIRMKIICRYSEAHQQYCIHEKYFDLAVEDYLTEDSRQNDEVHPGKVRAYLLGMYIAKEHPDGRILARYTLRNQPFVGRYVDC